MAANPYVSVADFRMFAPYSGNLATTDETTNIYAQVPDAVIQMHLDAASAMFNNAFRPNGSLPLDVSKDISDIRMFVMGVAAYNVMKWVGFASDAQRESLEAEYARLVVGDDSWLTRVFKGYVSFADDLDATPAVHEGAPVVVLQSQRASIDDRTFRRYVRGREVI